MLAQLAGSLVAVLALAGTAWALRLGGGAIGDEAAAIRVAEEALSGFEGSAASIGSDGRAAIVRGQDGSFALLKLAGARVAARKLMPPVEPVATEAGLTVDSGDRWFGTVMVAGIGALP